MKLLAWDEWRGSFDGRPSLLIKKLLRFAGCVIQVHKFVRADDPGCFHTHPAYALRIVVWGGYIEETGNGRLLGCWPGYVGIVAPEFEHRIDRLINGRSSWSLWIRLRKIAPINIRGC